MASYLLRMLFGSDEQNEHIRASVINNNPGLTFTNVNNKITFNKYSILTDSVNARCAYFPPYNNSEGFEINTGTNNDIQERLNGLSSFTIYFKYKINSIDMEEITPIISYKKDDNTIAPFLYIKDQSYFTYDFQNNYKIYSKNSNHTFNGKWHTFCLTRYYRIYRFFIDGLLVSQYDLDKYEVKQNILSNLLYIGYSKNNSTIYTFNNGYLDDICILEGCVYARSFIPPTFPFKDNDKSLNYNKNGSKYKKHTSLLTKYDSLYKYKKGKELNEIDKEILKEYDDEFVNVVKKIYTKTKNEICKKIKMYNIIPLDFSWSIVNYFYNNGNMIYLTDDKKYEKYISIEISDLDMLFIDNSVLSSEISFNYDPFKNNLEETYADIITSSNKNLRPIVLFINNLCIKLSSILIIKDNEHYFLLINKEELSNIKKIKSIDILLFPINTEIKYTENSNDIYTMDKINEQYLFSFDSNGNYNSNIYNPNNKCWYFLNNTENYIISHYSNYNIISETDIAEPKTDDIEYTDKDFVLTTEIRKINNLLPYENSNNFYITDKYKVKVYNVSANYTDKPLAMPSISSTTKGTFTDIKGKSRAINTLLDNVYIKFLLFSNTEGGLLIPNIDYKIEDNIIELLDEKYFNKTLHFSFFIPRYENYLKYIDPLYIKLNFKEKINTLYIFDIQDNIKLTTSMIYYMIIKKDNNHYVPVSKYKINEDNDIEIENMIIEDTDEIYICLLQIKDTFNSPLKEKDKIISSYIKNKRSFILYPLNIDSEYIITLDNFICFDQNGEYIPRNNIDGEVYNSNIIKYLYCNENNTTSSTPQLSKNKIVQDIVCLYNINEDEVPKSLNNTIKISKSYSRSYLQKYLTLDYNIYNFEDLFYILMNEFDFNNIATNLDYYQIYARFLNYILSYNQNIFDFYYEEKSNIIKSIYENTNGVYKKMSKIDRDKYFTSKQLSVDIDNNNFSHSYYLFFTNNILASWMNILKYDLNSNKLIESPDAGSQIVYNNMTNSGTLCKYFDVFEIKNISNFLYKVTTNSLQKQEVNEYNGN